MIGRLHEINTDFVARRELAETKSLGEIEGIDLTLQFLQDKRADAHRLAGLGPIALGIPAIRIGVIAPPMARYLVRAFLASAIL